MNTYAGTRAPRRRDYHGRILPTENPVRVRSVVPGQRKPHRSAALATLLAACMPFSVPAQGEAAWQHEIALDGRHAQASRTSDGFALRDGGGRAHSLTAGSMRSDTASAMFDGLFALAQEEMRKAKVESITDSAFRNGEPIPCPCFETGEKWRYVWTRDLSFAADLALARLEPQRTRDSLRFKLSSARTGSADGLFVAQDTGSGGSWPISSDRVVWFLAAEGLVDAQATDTDARHFRDEVWRALTATLAQDRRYVFDEAIGLYRGETSFLDWREQTYPRWTGNDVAFLAQSHALSTNVLHHRALRLAERMARERGDARASAYAAQAAALATAIEQRFWREERGLYMSYIGTAAHPVPYEAYDLLGLALLVDSGIAPVDRARRALANYPRIDTGSPVIWPQQPGIAIYHNRAIWPFVSAYSLRAARRLDDADRIAHEIRSLMRGAALAGSNMENFELVTQAVHVDEGPLSGPVVNSPRQLWSVAGYLGMVIEGVFGVAPDGSIAPKIPVSLVPMLFGDRESIRLRLPERTVVLHRPGGLQGELLVAGTTHDEGDATHVHLVAAAPTPRTERSGLDAAAFAPDSPEAPTVRSDSQNWRVAIPANHRLYVDGKLHTDALGKPSTVTLSRRDAQQCASLTQVKRGIESLHGPTRCVGDEMTIEGAWPRQWRAAASGRYSLRVDFTNTLGPINTGITAAVKTLVVQCDGQPEQSGTLVMPHGAGVQRSSPVVIEAKAGAECRIALRDGSNMSYLSHFALYTGGKGGIDGPLNQAEIATLRIVPVAP